MSNSEVFWATGHGISHECLSGLSYVQNRLILSVNAKWKNKHPFSKRNTFCHIVKYVVYRFVC